MDLDNYELNFVIWIGYSTLIPRNKIIEENHYICRNNLFLILYYKKMFDNLTVNCY